MGFDCRQCGVVARRRSSKGVGGGELLVLALIAIAVIGAIVAVIKAHPGTFIVLAVLVVGGWIAIRRRRHKRGSAETQARVEVAVEAQRAREREAEQRRREVEEEEARIEKEIEEDIRRWRETPLQPGRFTVTLTAVSNECALYVYGFLNNLHAFKDRAREDIEEFIERVQHISPQVVAAEITQRDAVRLKVELEGRGASVRITDTPVRATNGGGGREPIPERVRNEVWRRDGGHCVDCGSRERLEYDHIIPVSKGGSNTARNIELRCESCNRKKAAKV